MKWLCGLGALYVALGLGVWSWVRLPSVTPLAAGERHQIVEALRRGTPAGFAGPLVVQVYHQGRPQLRIEAGTLDDAVRQFAAAGRPSGRLMIHLLRGRAPLPGRLFDRWPLLFALSVVPGVDGLSLEVGGREALLLPDDLLRAGALGGEHPLPQLDLDMGIDVGRVLSLALDRLGIGSGGYESAPHTWRRLRVESFADEELPPPEVTREALLQAARAAGDYLVRHLGADGRYDYAYDPIADKKERDEYSLPRHAGATYFLGQLLGATGNRELAEPAARALQFLASRRRARGSVGEGRDVDLGTAALSLVAAAQYQRVSGDDRFLPWMRELAGFLHYMQRDSGDFRHFYRPDEDAVDDRARAPYYSGEAALALALFASVDEPAEAARHAAAAERGVDYLIGPYYDFFLGQFLYAEDHWTCLAADALADRLTPEKLARYARFCDGFAAFLRRMQYTDADGITRAHPEYSGAYGVGSILPPHIIPVGSRSECVAAVFRLDRRAGLPTQDVRRQLLRSMEFLLARPLDRRLWQLANPAEARGGIPQSDVNLSVRIDGVQHVGSALLGGAAVLSVID